MYYNCVGNIARGKQITLNQQYCPECDTENILINAYGPSLAVDGKSKNKKHYVSKYYGNCAKTEKDQKISSMNIDFGDLFVIYNVTVFGTSDGG